MGPQYMTLKQVTPNYDLKKKNTEYLKAPLLFSYLPDSATE